MLSIIKDPNERIVLVLRRHWVIITSKIFVSIILFLMPFVIFFILSSNYPDFTEYPYNYIFWFVSLLYIGALWLYFLTAWLDYYLDIWIVTNKRIVDIEQHGLFKREVSEFSISKVQDITINIRGVFQTLFKYGNVQIQTASESKNFTFHQVPNPYKAKDIILKYHDEFIGK